MTVLRYREHQPPRGLVCEGDDEPQLLPRLTELAFRNAPTKLNRFRRWSILRLHGATNQPIARLLAQLVGNDVVRAQARDEAFRGEVVLDRDHVRVPGTSRAGVTGDVVQERQTLWSQHSLESLLLEPGILRMWIEAFAPRAVPELGGIVAEVIRAAHTKEALNTAAREQLAAALAGSELRDAEGRVLSGHQKFVHAQREAERRVRAEPAVWQRGKDRAKVILGAVRAHLPPPTRNQFPTDVVRLVARARLGRIGDPDAAIPAEARALLDRMVE